LQQQLKYVVDQEKNVRDELKGTRKEFEDYKKKAEEKIHGLQRQMLKLKSEVEEVFCVGFLTALLIKYFKQLELIQQ
jgi:predicted  nucleic acid-binding Zn-ribbon protein